MRGLLGRAWRARNGKQIFRPIVVAALSLIGIAATSSAAFAISDFDQFTCRADGTNSKNGAPSFTNGPFFSIAAGTATLHIAAGQTLTITLTGGVDGSIVRQDTGQTIISPLLGDTTESLSGPLDVTIEVPAPGILGAPPGPPLGGVSVTMSCAGGGGGVFVPAAGRAQLVNGALVAGMEREPNRIRRIFDYGMESGGGDGDCGIDGDQDYEDALVDAIHKEHHIEAEIDDISGQLLRYNDLNPGEIARLNDRLRELRGDWFDAEEEVQCLIHSPYYRDGDIEMAEWEALEDHLRGLADDASETGLYGAGFFYIPGTDTVLKIGGFVDTGVVHDSFDAIDRTASIGSATLLGSIQVDPTTMLILGLKAGGTRVVSGNFELDQNNFGVDVAATRKFNLGGGPISSWTGKLYAGMEHGMNFADDAGATARFGSNTLKFAAGADAHVGLGNFTLTPSVLATFQYLNHGDITFSDGAMVPGGGIFKFNGSAGALIGTELPTSNPDFEVYPYFGGFLDIETVCGSAFPGQRFGPNLHVRGVAGLNLEFPGGTASIQADASAGTGGFWGAGLTVGASIRY